MLQKHHNHMQSANSIWRLLLALATACAVVSAQTSMNSVPSPGSGLPSLSQRQTPACMSSQPSFFQVLSRCKIVDPSAIIAVFSATSNASLSTTLGQQLSPLNCVCLKQNQDAVAAFGASCGYMSDANLRAMAQVCSASCLADLATVAGAYSTCGNGSTQAANDSATVNAHQTCLCRNSAFSATANLRTDCSFSFGKSAADAASDATMCKQLTGAASAVSSASLICLLAWSFLV
ncbi:hypothetical protein BC830DRAFT_1125056 [Chytriomyces sp. MP71]|nr:hypothetical protein BC830DRAFT_1125056 [Chytriomyces sp. MP71]